MKLLLSSILKRKEYRQKIPTHEVRAGNTQARACTTRYLLPAPAGAASTRPGLPAGLGLQPRRHPSESCRRSTAISSRTRRGDSGPSPSKGPTAARDPDPGPAGGHAAAATRPPCWPGSGAGRVGDSSRRLRGWGFPGFVPRSRLPGRAASGHRSAGTSYRFIEPPRRRVPPAQLQPGGPWREVERPAPGRGWEGLAAAGSGLPRGAREARGTRADSGVRSRPTRLSARSAEKALHADGPGLRGRMLRRRVTH